MKDRIIKAFRAQAGLLQAFEHDGAASLAPLAEACIGALRSGGKIIFFGNGGSAADAQHLAAELVNRFQIDRQALAALALTTDSSVITSIGNDSSFEDVFRRQVAALGKAGDVAVGLSTSGASANVIAALQEARSRGLVTAVFTGSRGKEMAGEADYAVVVPSSVTARVQETHITAGHALCAEIEQALAGESSR